MGRGTIRALIAAVVAMGLLIVAGTATLAVLIAGRIRPGPAAGDIGLDEPEGTRIAAVTAAEAGLVLLLTGGGGDRVVLVDPHAGRVLGRVNLGHAGRAR